MSDQRPIEAIASVAGNHQIASISISKAEHDAGALTPDDARTLEHATRLYLAVTHLLRLTVEGQFAPPDATPSLRTLIARGANLASFEGVEAELTTAESTTRALFERAIGGFSCAVSPPAI